MNTPPPILLTFSNPLRFCGMEKHTLTLASLPQITLLCFLLEMVHSLHLTTIHTKRSCSSSRFLKQLRAIITTIFNLKIKTHFTVPTLVTSFRS
ncbi:hypothetical protein F2Q69_00009631 [Brassica cretica]|uniref:Uncharacterized protein n=1 Tax=Brassica cretica TaxID=69181 RepID=A0A8S9NU44_BRACR|nr:hypothetical protein F2Q69_00009631 [Brassica cretica]